MGELGKSEFEILVLEEDSMGGRSSGGRRVDV